MKFSPYVTNLLKQKSNKDFRISADCEYLALDIESKTGEHIGVNTIKRLLGMIEDEREPRLSTLDIIARYLDFNSWDELRIYDDKSNSSFDSLSDEIRVGGLSKGQKIEISYLPDRLLSLEYLGDHHFRILSSLNSKLQDGDQIEMSHIVSGYPLLVSDVIRDGKSLGSFVAGKSQGIAYLIKETVHRKSNVKSRIHRKFFSMIFYVFENSRLVAFLSD